MMLRQMQRNRSLGHLQEKRRGWSLFGRSVYRTKMLPLQFIELHNYTTITPRMCRVFTPQYVIVIHTLI